MTKPRATKPAAVKAQAIGDQLAQAIEGARRLRADGFVPVRVVVGGASIDLAVPAYRHHAGQGSDSGAPQGPVSLAEEYLGKDAAGALTNDDAPPGAKTGDGDDESDYVPAVGR